VGIKVKEEKLEILVSKNFPDDTDLYKVIDFLNKTLSNEYNLIFGISKVNDNCINITIYKV
jgi:hypothetical protein